MPKEVSYKVFRENFINAARENLLDIFSISHGGVGPDEEPLYIDVVHGEISPELPTLIHLSGCHGVEGYLGSAIQTEILKNLKNIKGVNLCLIHALNPYGMAWFRRGNGANVDLNRNYFKEGEPRPENPGFKDFAPLFQWWYTENRFLSWYRFFKSVLKKGPDETSRVMATGQYDFPSASFYGGKTVAKEITATISYLKALLKNQKHIVLVDVHTGLGKKRSENFLTDGEFSPEEWCFWTSTLPHQPIDVARDSKFYKPSGALSRAFRHGFEGKKFYYICEEFGTCSPMAMFRVLIKDQRDFHKGQKDPDRIKAMLKGFYPSEERWRRENLHRGVKLVQRTTEMLRSPKII